MEYGHGHLPLFPSRELWRWSWSAREEEACLCYSYELLLRDPWGPQTLDSLKLSGLFTIVCLLCFSCGGVLRDPWGPQTLESFKTFKIVEKRCYKLSKVLKLSKLSKISKVWKLLHSFFQGLAGSFRGPSWPSPRHPRPWNSLQY